MSHYLFLLSTIGITGFCLYSCYNKIFGPKQYKVLKDYVYKNSRIQLISNPHENICAECCEMLNEHEQIGRFPHCDHHFCESCIHRQVDESQSDLQHPCKMCMV